MYCWFKLEFSEFEQWPEVEQAAVKNYFQAWWNFELSSIDSYCQIYGYVSSRIDECLECVAMSLKNIDAFLELWLRHSSVSASRHFSHFICSNYGRLVSEKKLYWVWCDEVLCNEKVVKFLLDVRTLKKIEDAFLEHSNEAFAFEFSEAVKMLEYIRSVFEDSQKRHF